MTVIESTVSSARRDLKVISLIGTAHFFSHFTSWSCRPCFRCCATSSASATPLGLALAVLNGVTGLTQAPVGFLVDRFGARTILIAGLALFSLAIGLIGLFPSYPMLIALMMIAGLGNSVFHPADYAILSSAVEQRRMGRAFSIHTFGGHAGFALAPPVIVFLTALFDWRIALALSGVAGLVVSLLLVANGDLLHTETDHGRRTAARSGAAGVRLLLSGPILMALLFFAMLAVTQGGYMSFSVAAIEALYQVPLAHANLPSRPTGGERDRRARGRLDCGSHPAASPCGRRLLPARRRGFGIDPRAPAAACDHRGAVRARRLLLGRGGAVARHDGARGDAPGGERQGVRFRHDGLQRRGIAAPLLFGAILDYGDPGLVFWTVAGLSLLTLLVVYATARSGQQHHTAPAHR